MNDDTFDPAADSTANYFFALRMIRLRAVLTGEVWARDDEPFDLVMAAALMRGRE